MITSGLAADSVLRFVVSEMRAVPEVRRLTCCSSRLLLEQTQADAAWQLSNQAPIVSGISAADVTLCAVHIRFSVIEAEAENAWCICSTEQKASS